MASLSYALSNVKQLKSMVTICLLALKKLEKLSPEKKLFGWNYQFSINEVSGKSQGHWKSDFCGHPEMSL